MSSIIMISRSLPIMKISEPIAKKYIHLSVQFLPQTNDFTLLSSRVALKFRLQTITNSTMVLNNSADDKGKGKSNNPLALKKDATVLKQDPSLLQKPMPDTVSSSDVKAKDVVKETLASMTKPKSARIPVDLTAASLERNFITPGRAMSDFLLKVEHLENLRATKRRSPYINQPPITVYWRKDVEAKAVEVWGSKDNLMKELLRREVERKFEEQNIATAKRQLRTSRREGLDQDVVGKVGVSGLMGPSGKVVLSAIVINSSNFLLKLGAWLYTGSHSMFSECIHSLADTMNQVILAYGIHKSIQKANPDHPYGYTNMRYVSSLISGVGIFCVGTGLSVYHGILGLLTPGPLESFYWAFFVLGGSFISEGATLLVALNSLRKGALASGMSTLEYIWSAQDPSVNVVLLEDCAAILSIGVTGVCMGLTSYLDTPVPDAVGSLIIGGLLGVVASFIIHTNVNALTGRSVPQDFLDKINYELESDVMVRAIHDVKGIDMGNNLIRYKAEIDFDGRELTRSYLDHQDLASMLEEVRNMKSIDEFESFVLKHSENIIDTLGGEIDRMEVKLRKKYPQIRHCDLEIL